MAGGPGLPHNGQQAIAITIHTQVDQFLNMSGALSLDPEFLPGPAPIGNPACLECPAHSIGIHPGQHEHFPIFFRLRDNRQQSHFIKRQRRRIKSHLIFPFATEPEATRYVGPSERESHVC